VVRPAIAVRRVAVARQDDLGLEGVGSGHGVIEVVDLEPQQDAVAVGLIVRIADRSVVVCDLKAVELEYEFAIPDQPLVFRPAVGTVTAEEMLIPATARFHIRDCYEGLGAHPKTSMAEQLCSQRTALV
jgi:hypothetical protein